ncbi:MAG: globin domain-containing protein [Chloroflexota bacterium]
MIDSAHILQSSFQTLLQNDPEHNFVREFFVTLRGQDPRLRELFETVNWNQQHNKFLLAMMLIVENIEDPNHYTNTLESMGEDHLQRYGVTRDMMPAFRAALINTLQINLKDEWTPEVEKAWTDGVNAIFKLMFPPQ